MQETIQTYLKMKDSPAVDVMYADMIKEKGALWLYGAVFRVLSARGRLLCVSGRTI
jgi:hypothetical protein